MTIKGTNFGTNQDTSYVFFAGTMALQYSSWSDTEIKVKVPVGTQSGKLWVTVSGKKSNEVSFTVLIKLEDLCDKPDVKIGNQIWMGCNLNVNHYRNGDSIPEVTDPRIWSNLRTGAWCYYDNDQKNNGTYGKLYNWYAVNDPRGLAPSGWHVPSDAEWTTLSDYLGGEYAAGGKLKEAGIGLWDRPNTGATNESGFSAIPGGGRNWIDGHFYNKYYECIFWLNKDWGDDNAASISLMFNQYQFQRVSRSKKYGFSVRCLKD